MLILGNKGDMVHLRQVSSEEGNQASNQSIIKSINNNKHTNAKNIDSWKIELP